MRPPRPLCLGQEKALARPEYASVQPTVGDRHHPSTRRRFLGYTGYSLLTRGYRLLGLSEQELAKLDEAVRKIPVNQLHYELRMELVRKQMARQLDDQARTHLEFLMQSSPDIYGQQAQFLLAQLSYRQSQYAACAGQLRKLLSEKVPTELRDQSLALLGKTYSSLGSITKRRCVFAGLLPGEQERPVAIKGEHHDLAL